MNCLACWPSSHGATKSHVRLLCSNCCLPAQLLLAEGLQSRQDCHHDFEFNLEGELLLLIHLLFLIPSTFSGTFVFLQWKFGHLWRQVETRRENYHRLTFHVFVEHWSGSRLQIRKLHKGCFLLNLCIWKVLVNLYFLLFLPTWLDCRTAVLIAVYTYKLQEQNILFWSTFGVGDVALPEDIRI